MNAKSDTTLKTKANELGVSADKVPFILKLVEREGLVKEDGSIDEEKAVSSLNTVIEAFPDFKGESKATGFKKVGGSTKVSEETEDEELKRWRKEAGLD